MLRPPAGDTTLVEGRIQLADEVAAWPASRLQLDNGIVSRWNPGGSWVVSASGTQLNQANTLWYDANSSATGSDPQFVDRASHDYRLHEGSPAIDAGSSVLTTSSTDLDGNTRISGEGVDQAPYEFPRPLDWRPVFTGLANGQMVSGTIVVQPDQSAMPPISQVAYSIDRVPTDTRTASPFTLGGSAGFDTRVLSNGPHVLSGIITAGGAEKPFSISFTVDNTPRLAQMIGLADGQTVSGTIFFGPDLNRHPDVRKAAYYLDGTQSGKVYQAPFYWGSPTGDGTQGFDTRTLPNGTYTLAGYITTSTGDLEFAAITFTVAN